METFPLSTLVTTVLKIWPPRSKPPSPSSYSPASRSLWGQRSRQLSRSPSSRSTTSVWMRLRSDNDDVNVSQISLKPRWLTLSLAGSTSVPLMIKTPGCSCVLSSMHLFSWSAPPSGSRICRRCVRCWASTGRIWWPSGSCLTGPTYSRVVRFCQKHWVSGRIYISDQLKPIQFPSNMSRVLAPLIPFLCSTKKLKVQIFCQKKEVMSDIGKLQAKDLISPVYSMQPPGYRRRQRSRAGTPSRVVRCRRCTEGPAERGRRRCWTCLTLGVYYI